MEGLPALDPRQQLVVAEQLVFGARRTVATWTGMEIPGLDWELALYQARRFLDAQGSLCDR